MKKDKMNILCVNDSRLRHLLTVSA